MKKLLTTLIIFVISLLGYAQEYRVLLFEGNYSLASAYEKSIEETGDISEIINQYRYRIEVLEDVNVACDKGLQIHTVAQEKSKDVEIYITREDQRKDEINIQFNREIKIAKDNIIIERQGLLNEALRLGKCVLLDRKEDIRTIKDGTPILKDIPLLGKLFQTTATSRQVKDIILYVKKID